MINNACEFFIEENTTHNIIHAVTLCLNLGIKKKRFLLINIFGIHVYSEMYTSLCSLFILKKMQYSFYIATGNIAKIGLGFHLVVMI